MMSEKMNTCTALLPISSEVVVGNLILDDSFEDGCSICLEPFSSLDPAFVTKCKHEYHLQCILDWSQRSSQCPVCLQHLVLNDPASQQMIAAAEREKKLRQKAASYQENEANSMQHSPAAVRARIITRRRRRPSAPRDVPYCSDSSPSVPAPALHINSRSRSTEFAAISDSLKSKLSTASVRYRESLSKGTRSLKEKIMARNDSVKELSRGVQREMSAGIAGIARLIARKRAGLCGPSGASHARHARRVEDDSIVRTLLPAGGGMSSNPTNAVAQVA